MKELFENMIWGENDAKTRKHKKLGAVVFAIFFLCNCLLMYFTFGFSEIGLLVCALSALPPTIAVASIWEYQQYNLVKDVKFDVKDVFMSCLFALLVTAVIAVIVIIN